MVGQTEKQKDRHKGKSSAAGTAQGEVSLGSLFDGIGVFPLAAVRQGIRPAWASEIEKSSISITRRHFPEMRHLGDVAGVHGGKVEPVHVITFGSPCQDLSTAGLRKGLAGAKSGLFAQAVRIIEEMRCATDGMYPAFAVWENVMGAFSSNDRMDFRTVLESFAGTQIPMPASGRWAGAGMVRGGRADIGWRVMDAQYWGRPPVPQRRKRIFLVADFRGQRAGEVLFIPQSLLPDSGRRGSGRLQAPAGGGIPADEAGREIPVVRPIQERRLRGAATEGNAGNFLRSLGRSDDPFPTLLASSVDMFSFWYQGREREGVVRYLTPLECERLQGLPDGWTARGDGGQPISDSARYVALGNSIALPCAEYVLSGIARVLGRN